MHRPEAVADLDARFAISGIAKVVSGNGGLSKVLVTGTDADGEMYLHGGHVTSWAPKGIGETLYLSPNSQWKDGQAIRGGVPVSFPWFAERADGGGAPPHGLVRTKAWQLQCVDANDMSVTVSMFTESDDETRKWWPYDYRLVCRATFGAQLKVELIVTNIGNSSFLFEEALHAYFAVGDAEMAYVRGLDGTQFIDKTDRHITKKQLGDVRIASETDSVYLNNATDLELLDPTLNRRLTMQKQNSLTTVVWNPGAVRSCILGDLGAGRWKHFLCIEPSNVGPYSVQLGSGQCHSSSMVVQAAHIPQLSR